MADRKGLFVSVALGTLLISLTAFAASVMVGDGMAADPVTPVGSTGVATQPRSSRASRQLPTIWSSPWAGGRGSGGW